MLSAHMEIEDFEIYYDSIYNKKKDEFKIKPNSYSR